MITKRKLNGLLATASVATIFPSQFLKAKGIDEKCPYIQDALLCARILKQYHPGLFRYQTTTQFNNNILNLTQSTNQVDFFKRLVTTLAAIRCGHTYPNFYNQSEAVKNWLVEKKNKLPFLFEILGNRILATANPMGFTSIKPGDEIMSINNTQVKDILDILIPLTRADGDNEEKRKSLLSVKGYDTIYSFDVYHPLFFPSHTQNWEIEITEFATNKKRHLILPMIDNKQRILMSKSGSKIEDENSWELSFDLENIAIIRMDSWATYKAKWDWREKIRGFFDEISARKPKGLILDIRANEGGEDCGNELISYLIASDILPTVEYKRLVRYRNIDPELSPYLDTWDRSFDKIGINAREVSLGYFELPQQSTDRVIKAKRPQFLGTTIVLSSAQNSSACFNFVRLMKQKQLAIIVGTPTGGNLRGINGGSFYFVRLPQSGIEFDLPLIGYFPYQTMPNSGISPDVVVHNNQQDIANGFDRQLSFAKELILKAS